MKHLRWMFFLTALSLAPAEALFAQAVNATLLGTVTDASGASIPNATITITETNTGVSRTAKTNESGNYTVPDLPPGEYSVTVESTGFKKETRPQIDQIGR